MNSLYALKQFFVGALNPKGNQLNTAISQGCPTFIGKLTQATTAAPSLAVTCDSQYPSTVTLTPARTSAGVYTVTASGTGSSNAFGSSAAKFWAANTSFVDTSNADTKMKISWTSATVIAITTTNSSGTAKDALVTLLPIAWFVFPD